MIATPGWTSPVEDLRISGSTFGNPSGHAGVDLWAPVGVPVVAAQGGRIHWAAFEPGGYGNLVKIDGDNGYGTRYGHLLDTTVSQGDTVTPGQLIGHADTTGRAFGSHVHFEIREGDSDGLAVDPWPLLQGASSAPSNPGAGTATLAGVSLPDPTDILPEGIADILGPIRDLIASVPASFIKVITGGRSLTEISVRVVELVGGGILLAIGGVMLLRTIAEGGDTGRAVAGVRRSTRTVARPARRGVRQVRELTREPSREPGRARAPRDDGGELGRARGSSSRARESASRSSERTGRTARSSAGSSARGLL